MKSNLCERFFCWFSFYSKCYVYTYDKKKETNWAENGGKVIRIFVHKISTKSRLNYIYKAGLNKSSSALFFF